MRRARGVRRDLHPQHADPRRFRPARRRGGRARQAGTDPVRAGAQRARRRQHGGCPCARLGRPRRRGHQHRHRRRQRLRRDGRGADGRHAGAAPHRPDRSAVPRPRARLHPRGAGAARDAARGVEDRIPGAQPRDRAGDPARGGASRAHPAHRAGQRRDPDRRAGRGDRTARHARARDGHAAAAVRRGARPARRAARPRQAPAAVARRRRAPRGRRGPPAARPRLRRRDQRAGARRRSRGPSDVARGVQPLRAGGEVLRHLRRDGGRGLAAAQQRDAQVQAQAAAPPLPHRRRSATAGTLLRRRRLRPAATPRWRSPVSPTASPAG